MMRLKRMREEMGFEPSGLFVRFHIMLIVNDLRLKIGHSIRLGHNQASLLKFLL